MGYTTTFSGHFELDRPLYDFQILYLLEFARTRRVKRNEAMLTAIPETAKWIEDNLIGLYGAGTNGGFHNQEIGEAFIPSCYLMGAS